MKRIIAALLVCCQVCACVTAMAECSHDELYTSIRFQVESVTGDINEFTHMTVMDQIEERYCIACGECVYTEILEEPGWAYRAHSWDGEGKCYGCGGENPCEHLSAVPSEIEVYYSGVTTKADDKRTHSAVAGDISVAYTCLDCGGTFSRYASPGERVKQTHFYLDGSPGSKCEICGYANPCRHKHTYIKCFDTMWGTAAPGNAMFHRVSAQEELYCADCELFVSYGDMVSITQIHDMHGQLCRECGYRCVHPSRKTRYIFGEARNDDRWNYVPIDSETHSFTGNLYEIIECTECGALLAERPYVTKLVQASQEGEEAHSLDRGVCWLCGYKATTK